MKLLRKRRRSQRTKIDPKRPRPETFSPIRIYQMPEREFCKLRSKSTKTMRRGSAILSKEIDVLVLTSFMLTPLAHM